MLPILEYDLYKYLALAVMLLAILFAFISQGTRRGFCKQSVACLDSRSSHCVCDSFTRSKRLRYHDLSWLQVRSNSARTLRVSIFQHSSSLPFDFAVMNWPFVALY